MKIPNMVDGNVYCFTFAGTRSRTRGINSSGACANYVETEQVLFFLWFFSWTKSFSCHSWWVNHHLVQQWAYSIMAGFGHAEPQLWSKNIEQNAFLLAFPFGLNDCMSRAACLWRGLKVNIKIIWHIASTRQELWN